MRVSTLSEIEMLMLHLWLGCLLLLEDVEIRL